MDQNKQLQAAAVTNAMADYIVVGAGISGCTVAGQLAAKGHSVQLIDKARGTGGRLSSKRLVTDDIQASYDLGAQKFEISNDIFRSYVEARDDLVVEIAERDATTNKPGTVQVAYADSRNSLLARAALGQAKTLFGRRVTSASFDGSHWLLNIESKDGVAQVQGKHLVLAAPPKQAATVLGTSHALFKELSSVEHEAQWVAMFALDSTSKSMRDQSSPSLASLFGEAQSSELKTRIAKSRILEAVALDNLKQGRETGAGCHMILVHATHAWTSAHLDDDKSAIEQTLLSELSTLLRLEEADLTASLLSSHVHRWLYARPLKGYALPGDRKSVV